LVPPGGRQGYFATTTGARVLAEAGSADFDATVAWLAGNPDRMGHEDLMGLANAVTRRINADAIGFLKQHAGDGSLRAMMPAVNSALLNDAGGQRPAIWEWLKSQPEGGVFKELRDQIVNSAGYQDPDLALRIVNDLPKTAEGDSLVRQVASSLLNGGSMLYRIDSMLEKAPERLRQPLIDTAFQYLRAENLDDPHKWLERAAAAPENFRAGYTARVAAAWAEQSPEDAVGWAATLPEGEMRTGVIASAASSWAVKDAYGASEWIDALPPGPDRERAANSLATVIAADAPEEAWEWALSITDENLRVDAAWRALAVVFKRDPATAEAWIRESPLSPTAKERLRLSLESDGPHRAIRPR
jgi:hypothetical protein